MAAATVVILVKVIVLEHVQQHVLEVVRRHARLDVLLVQPLAEVAVIKDALLDALMNVDRNAPLAVILNVPIVHRAVVDVLLRDR